MQGVFVSGFLGFRKFKGEGSADDFDIGLREGSWKLGLFSPAFCL